MKHRRNRRQSNFSLLAISILLVAMSCSLSSQEVVRIWPELAPGSENLEDQEVWRGRKGVRNVYQPDITVFLPEKSIKPTAGVMVCPGGGYKQVVMEKEGYKIAHWLNENGIAAFVLKYRLKPTEALRDAQRAMSFIRANADTYGINPEKLGAMGFSAGANLVANVSENNEAFTYYDEIDSVSYLPDFLLSVYGIFGDISTEDGNRNFRAYEFHADLPPAFLVHAADDSGVPAKHSVEFYLNLLELGIPAELHVYEKGEHGFALERDRGPEVTSTVDDWSARAIEWFKIRGIL